MWNLTTSHKWKRFRVNKYRCLGILKYLVTCAHMYKETVLKFSMYYQHVIDVNKKRPQARKNCQRTEDIERSWMFSVFPAFAATNKLQYFRFLLPSQTPPLYKCRLKRSLTIEKYLVNEMNKCLILTANGRYKKIISPVPKGAESQKGDRNAKQASTLIISCKLHFKSNQSSKSLRKLHTVPIFCFAGYHHCFWQFWGEGGWSNTIHASSARGGSS